MCFNTEAADDTDQEDEQTMTIQAKNILIQLNMFLWYMIYDNSIQSKPWASDNLFQTLKF